MDVEQKTREDAHYDALHQAWLTTVLHAKEMVSKHSYGSPEASKAIMAKEAAWAALQEHIDAEDT